MRAARLLIVFAALHAVLCMASDTRINHRLRRGGMWASGLPEPCYPPPCPGVNYDHSDSVSAAALKALPGDVSVAPGGGDMNVNADNAGSPTIPMDNNDPSFTIRPQGYVIMLPVPPIPLSNDDDLEPECCNDGEGAGAPSASDLKTEQEDMKKVDKLSQRIELKKISLQQHDSWIEDAKKAMEKVDEHMKEAQASRDRIARTLDQFQTRHDEIINKYKVDQLKRKLTVAKNTLNSLQTEVGGLNAAGNGLEAAQKNIEAKVSLLAEKLNIQRDQAEQKAKEFDKANQKLTTVVANFEQYSPDHIAL